MSLKVSPDLELPNEAVTQTFAILAKRGAGKSYLASVMAEEMLKANLHTVIVDPIGSWWGLRASADGKSGGLPIIIAGGDHADVPLDKYSGETIANLIVNEGISMLIDLSLLHKGEQKHFMVDFAETLYHRNRNALHLILDEADTFAPQRPLPGDQRMLGAIEDLVRKGRARGLGVTMITQRPAILNKDVLTQIEVLVALRLTSPQDRIAINEWIKYHADTDKSIEMIQSLPSLPIGTAWFWSPGWLDLFQKVHIRTRETFDSSNTPKVGVRVQEATKLADVDIARIRDQLSETIKKAEDNDPKVLKRRIAELEQELAVSKHDNSKPEIREVKVPILSKEDIDALQNAADQITGTATRLQDSLDRYLKPAQEEMKYFSTGHIPSHDISDPVPINHPINNKHTSDQASDTSMNLAKAERSILTVLYQYPKGRTITQIALLSGYSSKGGGFRNALSKLRTSGYMEGSSTLSITQDGIRAIGNSVELLPTGHELIEYWKGRLSKAERLILESLTGTWPKSLTIEEVAEQTGYITNGGGFRNALSKLRTLELIEGRGEVKASDTLFT